VPPGRRAPPSPHSAEPEGMTVDAAPFVYTAAPKEDASSISARLLSDLQSARQRPAFQSMLTFRCDFAIDLPAFPTNCPSIYQ
jgi:hypothetical protein